MGYIAIVLRGGQGTAVWDKRWWTGCIIAATGENQHPHTREHPLVWEGSRSRMTEGWQKKRKDGS